MICINLLYGIRAIHIRLTLQVARGRELIYVYPNNILHTCAVESFYPTKEMEQLSTTNIHTASRISNPTRITILNPNIDQLPLQYHRLKHAAHVLPESAIVDVLHLL